MEDLIMHQLSPDLTQRIVGRLVDEFQPEQIALLGSHAWGKPTEDSDIDLLIIVPASDERPTRRTTRAYHSLTNILAPIDVLVKTRAEVERYRHVFASLKCEILKKGQVLYDRPIEENGA